MTTANVHTGSSFKEGRCEQGIAPSSALPKYAFNAKELDEETGMYYYEARYYAPPVFTSRDPMFEKYFWMTPYAYCANNPLKYVDPSGKKLEAYDNYSKRQMKKYFKQLFGSDKMFSFSAFNQMKVNAKQFDKAYASATSDQKKLLDGFKDAVNRTETAVIQVDKSVTKFTFTFDIDITTGVYKYGNEKVVPYTSEFSNLGGGATMWSDFFSCYLIGVDDAVKDNLTTDKQGTLTGSPAATFVHEVLDEFLNYNTAKTVKDNDSRIKKVENQNTALRILKLSERNGEDHQ